jgi:hypothetical protein
MSRSSQVGVAFHETLFAVAVFAGPCTVLAFLGLRWRRQVAASMLLLVASATTAEALAAVEEAVLLRRGGQLSAEAPVVFQARWWPHLTSYLFYEPSTGRLGAGD